VKNVLGHPVAMVCISLDK